jgi:hypothetical protein
MLDNLLEIIGFPEELNFELKDEIFDYETPIDIYVYKKRSTKGHEFIDNTQYRKQKYGKWTCVDINIVDVEKALIELNCLLYNTEQNLIYSNIFEHAENHKCILKYKENDDITIDFIKVDKFLSIQIIQFQPIIQPKITCNIPNY